MNLEIEGRLFQVDTAWTQKSSRYIQKMLSGLILPLGKGGPYKAMIT